MNKVFDMYILRNKIKYFRKLKHISQKTLASSIGVSQNTISDIETYKYFPSAKLSGLIAIYFGVPWEWIFYFEPTTNRLN